MEISSFEPLVGQIQRLSSVERIGLVTATGAGLVHVSGLSPFMRVGDLVSVSSDGTETRAEVVDISKVSIKILMDTGADGVSIGDTVRYVGSGDIFPDASWVGRVIDAYAEPLDGAPLTIGQEARSVRAAPPPATSRKRLGPTLETGIPVFNTFLPLVRGQRLGLFAGSGVGKSTLLAMLAQNLQADYVVIAMVGERGREVREFIEDTLGPEGQARSIVVAATSDQSAITRRRAAWTAMSVAEYLRDQGAHVLLLVDSITRFCEAHREIVSATGEASSIRGFPPSTTPALMSLCERSGPGAKGQGDITAIYSVLVAGSDMEEPVADMVRGVLDGHIILDRAIAERGRFPAIDVLRSVSRSFLAASTVEAQNTIASAKKAMAIYEDAEVMIQTGLYQSGADPEIDRSIVLRPQIEAFLSSEVQARPSTVAIDQNRLSEILENSQEKGRLED